MTPAELLANKGRLVKFRGCSLILKAAKTIHEKSGEIKVKALLKDTRHRSSYIIARAEEVKPHEETRTAV